MSSSEINKNQILKIQCDKNRGKLTDHCNRSGKRVQAAGLRRGDASDMKIPCHHTWLSCPQVRHDCSTGALDKVLWNVFLSNSLAVYFFLLCFLLLPEDCTLYTFHKIKFYSKTLRFFPHLTMLQNGVIHNSPISTCI